MTTDEASATAAVLADADLRGVHTHGSVRLPDYADLVTRKRWLTGSGPDELAGEGAVRLLDGQNGVGPYLGTKAMERAIDLAREHGAGWVWIRNAGHFGTAAYYSGMAAAEEMAGFAFTSSSPAMAPWQGDGAVLGSNPWSIAIPRPGAAWPLVLDISNTVTSRGAVKSALARGERIPPGWADDAAGRPTTEPSEALAGTMLPFGGHKGYAIAFIVAALVGAPAGSALPPDVRRPFGPVDGHQGVGQLFGALDLRPIVSMNELSTHLEHLVDAMHSGGRAVLVPGEREARTRADQLRHGIRLPSHAWEAIAAQADVLGLDPPHSA